MPVSRIFQTEKECAGEPMIELFDHLSDKDVNTCLVILAAAGIAYRITGQPGDWTVWVDEADSEPAIAEVGKYFQENKNFPDEIGNWSGFSRNIQAGFGAALIFLAVQVYINHHGGVAVYSEKFGASASAILDGEVFRIVTALMIHSDAMHLISNMAALVLLFTVVCSVWGSGVASFCLLASGALGNYLTALIYRTSHVSIGSSTAVFGALGMLIVHQVFSSVRHATGRMKAWLPIGAGLCLLGLFSEGAHTDILAHLFGLGSGMAIGVVFEMTSQKPPAPLLQYLFFSVTVGAILLAWSP
jgi:membrane associated rhomboid family serine protease